MIGVAPRPEISTTRPSPRANGRSGRIWSSIRSAIEISKAISYRSDILIVDKPTSAIGGAETELLFEAIPTPTAYGAGIIYVMHHLSDARAKPATIHLPMESSTGALPYQLGRPQAISSVTIS
jgi:hypothetical protein